MMCERNVFDVIMYENVGENVFHSYLSKNGDVFKIFDFLTVDESSTVGFLPKGKFLYLIDGKNYFDT